MKSLASKLILGFLIVSLTGAALMAFFARRATETEFGRFVFFQDRDDLALQLAEYYSLNSSWAGVEDAVDFTFPKFGGRRFGPRPPEGRGGEKNPRHDNRDNQPGPYALGDENGEIVIPGLGYHIGDQLDESDLTIGTAIIVDNSVVGTLFSAPQIGNTLSRAGNDFLARVSRSFVLSLGGAMAVALIVGIVVARTISRPLRDLTVAPQAVATGDFGRQVKVPSQDEVGRLATAFNAMSKDLARAETARRRMTADIAHDLRTPLSIILGHAEALRDGVLPLTPENLDVVHDEAMRLNRMVEDLRTLSQADAGELRLNKRKVSITALLEHAAAAYAPGAANSNIELRTELAADLPLLEADPDRLARVFGNLLDNALTHTPADGIVIVSAKRNGNGSGLRISISDTGPGIAAEDLPHVFQRFYRADKSRHRDGNGSGLGLAISKSIVNAHNGKIWAENISGVGTRFVIELPNNQ